MKIRSLSFCICIIITLMGCSSNKIHDEPSDKYPFEEKMKTVLDENLEVVNSLNRAEVQLAYIELPANSIETKKIIKLLGDDGWILKGSGVSVDTYCLGVRNSINIASPILFNATDYKGNKVKVTKSNVDIISYSYNKWGDDLCE
ncbi:hypothetical protein [Acinetobacter rongchengensis]|uniref:Lipoprotein n=1 Tax=Acinetobacter rongchengensis TaxID=2419601 RepID=A0A3A8FEF7_9GAMM|nr:hypothetical protein [Acinetobacter rongchengensis]RKG39541.1 hypothetical protein D7V20_04950 [Acinetobacter rongchengensis]